MKRMQVVGIFLIAGAKRSVEEARKGGSPPSTDDQAIYSGAQVSARE
jgi:hypothetical protein